MKKLILLTSVLLMTLNSFSQTVNFFADGSVWTYYTTESYEPGMTILNTSIEKDSIQGDTLINSIIYKRLFVQVQTTVIPVGCCVSGTLPVVHSENYIRYDTLLKSVYKVNDTGTFIPEVKIYDFNLVASDTIPLVPSFYYYPINVIDSVKNILFFGVPARKYFLPGFPVDNYIIEGMGGSNGLTYYNPNQIVVSGGIYMTTLQCFQSGDSIYNPSGTGCPSFITVGVSKNRNHNSEISIYPNPTTSLITVSSEGEKIKEIEIHNIVGELIYKINTSTLQTTIDLSREPKGIYFVRIIDNNRSITNKKIIIQ